MQLHRRRRPHLLLRTELGAALVGCGILAVPAAWAAEPPLVGTQPFANHRSPPPYRKLSDAEFARYDLGSAEEAILWHDGEAAGARERFEKLPATQRKAFLHWLETL